MQSEQMNNEQNSMNEEESTLDIRYIFFILMQKWWLILIFITLSGSVAASISYFYLEPVYSASSTMFVYRKVENEATLLNELNVGSQLVKDSVVLLKSGVVLSRAIAEAGAKMSPTQLAANLTASSEKDTRILRISVTDADPVMAAKLTNAIADSFIEVFKGLTQSNTRHSSTTEEFINVVDKAKPNPYPVKPNKQLNILIGLFLGAAIGVGIIFLMEFLDDTIKTPEAIRLHYNVDILGVVPIFDLKKSEGSVKK